MRFGWFSDNGIGKEGAKALGGLLKVNTIMKKLDLRCDASHQWLSFNATLNSTITDNNIGDEGVKALSDGLMMNTGLTELELQSQELIPMI